MGVVSVPNTFSANTTISSSQMNANFSTLYNEFNGSISSANLASSAVVAAKIATDAVETAKIKDLNVTTAKIADGAVTPVKRSGGFKIGVIPAATMGTTGNKAITGVGFTPKLVRFAPLMSSSAGNGQLAFGAMDENGNQYVAATGDTSATASRNSLTTACIGILNGGATTWAQLASYVSMDADGFTVNVSTAVAIDVAYEAYA